MDTVDEGTPLWGISAMGSSSTPALPGNDPMEIIQRALALLGPAQAPQPRRGQSILGHLGDAFTAAAAGYERRPMTGPGPYATMLDQRQREYAQGQAAARAHIIGSVLGQVLKPKKSPVYKTNDQNIIGAIDPDTHEFTPVTDESGNPVKAVQAQPNLGHETFVQNGRTIARFWNPKTGAETSRQDLGPAEQGVTWQWDDAKQGFIALPTKMSTGGAPTASAPAGEGETPSGTGPLATVSAPGARPKKPVTQSQINLDKGIEVLHNLRETFDNVKQMFRIGHGYRINPQSGSIEMLSPQEQSQAIKISGVPGQPPTTLNASPNNRVEQLAYGSAAHWGDFSRGIVSGLPGGDLAANHEGIRGKLVSQMIPQLIGQARGVVGLLNTFEGYIPPWTYAGPAAEMQFADADRTLYEAEEALKALRAGKDPNEVQSNIDSFIQSVNSGVHPSYLGKSANETEDDVVARPAEIAQQRADLQSRLQSEKSPVVRKALQGALDEIDKQTAAVNAAGGMTGGNKFAGHVMPKANFDKLTPEQQDRWTSNGGTVK